MKKEIAIAAAVIIGAFEMHGIAVYGKIGLKWKPIIVQATSLAIALQPWGGSQAKNIYTTKATLTWFGDNLVKSKYKSIFNKFARNPNFEHNYYDLAEIVRMWGAYFSVHKNDQYEYDVVFEYDIIDDPEYVAGA